METLHSLIYRVSECGIFDAMFSLGEKNNKLVGSVLDIFDKIELDHCTYRCAGQFIDCKSINFKRAAGQADWIGRCELNSKEKEDMGVSLEKHEGWIHLQTPPEDQQVKVSLSV